MTKYQLAKLMRMAGGLRSRKRIQKTVHLLQAAGCGFNLDFRLHYYGPYSSTLAERLDGMASNRMLLEAAHPTEVGTQYDYVLNQEFSDSLEAYEQTEGGRAAKEDMERFQRLLDRLGGTRARVLELASTMVSFIQSGHEWNAAQAQTSDFKAEKNDSPMMQEARLLAEEVLSYRDG